MVEIVNERLDVTASDTDPRVRVRLDGSRGQIIGGGEGIDGYLFLRAEGNQERIRLDGRAGSVYAGGQGSAGRLFLRRTATEAGRSVDHVAMSFDASNGNIRVGGNHTDGDLLLFPDGARDISVDNQSTIWLDSGHGNIAVGGNETDGDILLFPSGAPISTTETAGANIWLDGGPGNIQLAGALMPKSGPVADSPMPGFSVDEGCTAAFQGSQRFGVIDFTHESDSGGERGKLREIWIFNPVLHANSIVLVTPHTAAPVAHMVSTMERRHGITGGIGRFIDLHLIQKLAPGTHVRHRLLDPELSSPNLACPVPSDTHLAMRGRVGQAGEFYRFFHLFGPMIIPSGTSTEPTGIPPSANPCLAGWIAACMNPPLKNGVK